MRHATYALPEASSITWPGDSALASKVDDVLALETAGEAGGGEGCGAPQLPGIARCVTRAGARAQAISKAAGAGTLVASLS